MYFSTSTGKGIGILKWHTFPHFIVCLHYFSISDRIYMANMINLIDMISYIKSDLFCTQNCSCWPDKHPNWQGRRGTMQPGSRERSKASPCQCQQTVRAYHPLALQKNTYLPYHVKHTIHTV